MDRIGVSHRRVGRPPGVLCCGSTERGWECARETHDSDTPRELLDEAQRLSKEGILVTMEASSTAVYVREVLSEGGARVVVGHPAAIARFRDPKVKDDWIDAKLLAELYRLGAFPAVHHPSEWALRARDVCRYRHRLGEEATEVKNRIRSLIARNGLAEEMRQPFNRAGLASLRRRLQKGQLPHEVAVVLRGELGCSGNSNA